MIEVFNYPFTIMFVGLAVLALVVVYQDRK